MRLRRLDLTRYGKFTDTCIDFGERVEGAPDLHIVYGPNEAGKSTAFAAFLDLLFGIETKSRYDFLHPYSTMRIGACLELSTGPRELVRIKRPAASLRNAADEPVPESTILGDLGGLDRTAYRTMFSLDDDTLEAGGNAILASRGELGQLLFSASAGLSDLGKMLLELKARTDGFAKPAGRSGELQELKAELLACKQARDAIDTLASEYNKLAAARDLANAQYEAALAEYAAVKADLSRVQLLLAAHPRAAALGKLRDAIAQLPELPEAPPGWLDELPALQRDENHHRSETARAHADVKRLSEAVEGVSVDARAHELTGRLDRLAELRVRHVGAELDLPERRRERAVAEGQARAILVRLGRPDEREPARLLLNAAQSSALGSLIVSRSGVQADVTRASDELSRALHELTEARRALHTDSNARADVSLAPVKAAMAALRDSDHTMRLRVAARARTQHVDMLAARTLSLTPWLGSVEALAAARVPDAATVEAWSASAEKAAALVEQRRSDVERHDGELARRAAEHDADGKMAGLISDQEAADLRRAREAAWAEHRRTLDHDTADVFEATLRRDDIAAAARLGHERELAALHEAGRALAVHRAEAARAVALLQEAADQRQAQADALARALDQIGLDLAVPVTPSWLLAWLARREKALESWHLLRQAEREEAEAQADAARLRDQLAEALALAGLPPHANAALEALVSAAQAAIDSEAQAHLLGQAVAGAEREVRTRELAVQRSSLADKTWQAAWRQACAACWLGEEGARLPVETVSAMVAAVADLATILQAQALATGRIGEMEGVQAAFRQELEALVPALGIEPGQQSLLDLSQTILDRVQDAARAAAERQRLHDALALARDDFGRVERAAARHATRAGEMMSRMQAGSLIELAGKLRDAQHKADLLRQAAQEEREILSMLQASSLTEAQAMLAAAEALGEGGLPVWEARLAAQREDLEQRTRTLFAASKEAADRIAAVGGDDAAARLEEQRRTILLTIEDKARDYLRLRLGIAAAERALRAYRDQHRSAMMRQASDAFAMISRGAYRGLGTQPDRDGGGEVLIALAADGGSKLAVDLSKGTRFQLYLALRAAGYQEFAKLRPPVPFIADDIMETFDDFRAEETLRVLQGMARLGQVIYLTHHDHLRAIAERTTPGVRLHRLGA